MNCGNLCCENSCPDHHDVYGRYGINVTAMFHVDEPLLVEQAAELVPVDLRNPGTKITFWTFYGWQTWQYQPKDIRGWVLPESWKQEATYGMDNIEDLQNQIDAIQIGGGWAVSNEFGDDPHIGISQKKLTEEFQKTISLDDSGKIPSYMLPSYVDDVIEGYLYSNSFYADNAHTELIDAESGKIYVDIPSKVSYRYSGTAYIAISNPYAPDEEDLTVTNDFIKFKDKAYNTSSYSGLGKKILRKNMVNGVNTLTQAMVGNANTVYIVQYDFSLNDESVEIPANSVLKFEGGSLNDGTLVGNMTKIDADKNAIFSGMTISGTWNVPEITSAWFADATTEDNVIKEIFKLTNDDVHNVVTIEDGTYTGGNPATQTGVITLGSNTEVNLIGKIKQLPNSWNYGYVVDIDGGAENIYIHGGGTIEGDWLEHLGSTGEHGHGVNIQNCSNVTVEDITIRYCWGDCVYVGLDVTPASNITLRNLLLDSSRRQGISITSAKNVVVENCKIQNIGVTIDGHTGTAPKAGIDIEPNEDSVVDNVAIKNSIITGCAGSGILLYNTNIDAINDVLIQNVIVDGCNKGIGGGSLNISGLTIDSVIVRNHVERGLVLEAPSSHITSDVRDINITNVFVDNQSNSEGVNVYINVYNGNIHGCTFKNTTTLKTYCFEDSDHEYHHHGLNISSTIILAANKTVGLNSGCVVSQSTIECELLRLNYGHTQFVGCSIVCGAVTYDGGESTSDPKSSNSFTACRINCTRNIILGNQTYISQSTIYATQINVGSYSLVTGSYIYSRLRINGSYTTINNNYINVGTSKLSEQYAVYSISSYSYCTVCNNNIIIQDDDTEVEKINGPVSIQGWGSIVSNNKITLQGSRSYSRYGIYLPSTSDNNVKVENNSFVYSEECGFINGMFPNTPTPIPYADNSKIKIGSTANRPTLVSCNKTFQYFDTTLGKPIWWTGSAWVDATGATV